MFFFGLANAGVKLLCMSLVTSTHRVLPFRSSLKAGLHRRYHWLRRAVATWPERSPGHLSLAAACHRFSAEAGCWEDRGHCRHERDRAAHRP